MKIELHASAVPSWGDCAARAKHIHEHGRTKRDDESVALAVGNAGCCPMDSDFV